MPKMSARPMIAAAAFMSGFPATVFANSMTVQLACASDYYAYCAKHDPDGPAVRACMRANGTRLSDRCLNALIAAGEVSKSEASRRASLRK